MFSIRTTLLPLLAALLMAFLPSQLSAYDSGYIYSNSDTASYDLDLNAVASIFGQSRDLADFEWRLNDPSLQISNLDLNGDYQVDYLRVIETYRNGIHLVVVQAVVGPNMYQDVATIEVGRANYGNTYVQIVGDPYLYGYNYIIEPYYAYTPAIFSYFWNPRGYYRPYHSHYRWGYYPRRYRPWRPLAAPYYRRHIVRHIDRRHRYRMATTRRNSFARELHKQVRRNDFAIRHPHRAYNRRQQRTRGQRGQGIHRGQGVNRSTRNASRNTLQRNQNRQNRNHIRQSTHRQNRHYNSRNSYQGNRSGKQNRTRSHTMQQRSRAQRTPYQNRSHTTQRPHSQRTHRQTQRATRTRSHTTHQRSTRTAQGHRNTQHRQRSQSRSRASSSRSTHRHPAVDRQDSN
jgi:hypothetical protein